MKKLIGLFSCLAFVYVMGTPEVSYALGEGETCSNARCHTVGEGYCLPGNAISFRERCEPINCSLGQSCDWVFPDLP